MPNDNQKVIIVTGAAHGIGKAICLEFAKIGESLVILDMDSKALSIIHKELETFGINVLSRSVDITNLPDVEKVIEEVKDKYGRIDILINNVGIGSSKRFLDTTPDDLERVTATNIKGPLFLTQQAVTLMMKGANIIFISSIFANFPSLDVSYDLTKAAINHLVTNLSLQLAQKEIRVNGIAPGHIDTKTKNSPRIQIDVPLFQKAGLPEDIAKACLFLTNNESARYITGVILPVTGGLHIPMLKSLSLD